MNCIACGKSKYRFVINQYVALCDDCVSGMYDIKEREIVVRESDRILLAFIMIGVGFFAGGMLALFGG